MKYLYINIVIIFILIIKTIDRIGGRASVTPSTF